MKKNRIYTVAIIFWVGIISCNSSKSNENEAVQTAETSSIIEVSAEQFKTINPTSEIKIITVSRKKRKI